MTRPTSLLASLTLNTLSNVHVMRDVDKQRLCNNFLLSTRVRSRQELIEQAPNNL